MSAAAFFAKRAAPVRFDPATQWARVDRLAKLEGINRKRFIQRAIEQRCASIEDLEREAETIPDIRTRLPGLP